MSKKWVSSRSEQKKKELGLVTTNKESSIITNNKSLSNETKYKSKDNIKSYEKHTINRSYDSKKYKVLVKISNVPYDCEVSEIQEQLEHWGEISNISIKHYNYKGKYDNTCIFINFRDMDDAIYFRDAHDQTLLGSCMIKVGILGKL